MMGSVLLPSLYSRSLPYDFADLFTKEMVSIPPSLECELALCLFLASGKQW